MMMMMMMTTTTTMMMIDCGDDGDGDADDACNDDDDDAKTPTSITGRVTRHTSASQEARNEDVSFNQTQTSRTTLWSLC